MHGQCVLGRCDTLNFVEKLPPSTPKGLTAAKKRALASEMRAQGRPFDAIATALGVSRAYAYRLVKQSLEQYARDCRESAEDIIGLELKRLDAMLLALWPNRADPRVVRAILQVMERRSAYLGLDKPVGVEVSGTVEHKVTLSEEDRMARVEQLLAQAHARRIAALEARPALIEDAQIVPVEKKP